MRRINYVELESLLVLIVHIADLVIARGIRQKVDRTLRRLLVRLDEDQSLFLRGRLRPKRYLLALHGQ